MTSFNLEQSARELTEAIAKGPPLSGVSLADARKAVEVAQSAPISMPDIDESFHRTRSCPSACRRARVRQLCAFCSVWVACVAAIFVSAVRTSCTVRSFKGT